MQNNTTIDTGPMSGLMSKRFYIIAAPSTAGVNEPFGMDGKYGFVTAFTNGEIQTYEDGKVDLLRAGWFPVEGGKAEAQIAFYKNAADPKNAERSAKLLRQQQIDHKFNLNQLAAVEMLARVRPIALTEADILQAQLCYAAINYEVFEESEQELIANGAAWLVQPPALDLSVAWSTHEHDDPGKRSVWDETYVGVVDKQDYESGTVLEDGKFDISTFAEHCRADWRKASNVDGLRFMCNEIQYCGPGGDSKLVAMRLFTNSVEQVSPLERPDMQEILARDLLARKLPEPVRSYALDRIKARELDKK